MSEETQKKRYVIVHETIYEASSLEEATAIRRTLQGNEGITIYFGPSASSAERAPVSSWTRITDETQNDNLF